MSVVFFLIGFVMSIIIGAGIITSFGPFHKWQPDGDDIIKGSMNESITKT